MKRYDSYKDSGVEWIGQIPSNWKLLTNKYFTKSQKNKSETGQEELLSVSEHKGVIPRRKIREGKEHLTRSESLVGYLKVRKGELVSNIMLMWKRGLGVSEHEGIVSPSYSVFSFKKSEPKYFHYLYRTDQYVSEFRRNSTGVIESRLRLYDDSFGSLKSHFPPLNEQKQIVEFLDTKTELIDSLIEKTERKIELLKEKRTSLINETVTKGLNSNVEMKDSGVEWIGEIPSSWENGRLGYYSSVFRGSGYQYLNQVDEDYEGGKERVVRISDISEFNPIWCEYQDQFENYRIQPDNILIGGTGHYFGKSIYVIKDMEGLIHSYNIIRVVIKNQYPKYIQYWLSCSKIREQMDISVLGSGQPFIDIQGLKDLHILIPPISEQQQIVEYLDEQTGLIDKTISTEKKRIDLLKEYRQSLISEVVTGKRKVTN